MKITTATIYWVVQNFKLSPPKKKYNDKVTILQLQLLQSQLHVVVTLISEQRETNIQEKLTTLSLTVTPTVIKKKNSKFCCSQIKLGLS